MLPFLAMLTIGCCRILFVIPRQIKHSNCNCFRHYSCSHGHRPAILNYLNSTMRRQIRQDSYMRPLIHTRRIDKQFRDNLNAANFSTVDTTDVIRGSFGDNSIVNVPKWAKEGLSIEHDGYEKVRGEYIPDVNCAVTYYTHKSGMKVVALVADPLEIESSFEIVFPTYPACDGGHPHIIEHSVLGGSKCYPSKKAFSKILQGGFDTFFNAFTYRDRTSYLFATINDVFYKQAMHYILDGVFRPNLLHDDKILRQEGWHLVVEPCESSDGSADNVYQIEHHGRKFSFSGVVYNEVKNKYSSITKQIYNKILSELHTNAYKFDSGGEPNCVAGLSYDSLVSFYKRFYTPSRSTIYIYTPSSLYDKLDFVHQFIQQLTYETVDVVHSNPLCTNEEGYRNKHVKVKLPYEPSGSVGNIIVTAWLIDPVFTNYRTNGDCPDNINKLHDNCILGATERIAWNVLEHVLMGTHKSLVHKILIPYGTNLYPGFFDPTHQQAILVLGIEGFGVNNTTNKSDEEDYIEKFTSIIDSALESKVKEGFSESELLSAINTVEFQYRELGSSYLPKGLQLSNAMHSQDIFGRDGMEALKFVNAFNSLRAQLKNGYFEKLVIDKLLNNQHRVTIHAFPDEKFTNDSKKAYANTLKTFIKKLSKEQIDQIQQEYQQFINEANDTVTTQEGDIGNNTSVPRNVKLSDISKFPNEIPSNVIQIRLNNDKQKFSYELKDLQLHLPGIPLLIQQVPSNGILYMDLAYSLRNVGLDELPAIKVLCESWRESVNEEFEEQIGIFLGGLKVSIVLETPLNNAHGNSEASDRYSNKNNSAGYLLIRTKFLAHNLDKAVDIVKQFFNTNITWLKHKEIIYRMINQMTLDITNSGHFYSQALLESRHSVVGYANEQINGYTFLKHLQKMSTDEAQVSQLRELLLHKILTPENVIVSFTGSNARNYVANNLGIISSIIKIDCCTMAFDKASRWASDIAQINLQNETDAYAILTPSANNFLSVGGPLLTEADDIGTHLVILHWLSFSLLWDKVREKGGAYGVNASLTQCGNFYITSYADPNILSTCDIIHNLSKLIRQEVAQMSDSDVDKQKIGTLAKLDAVLTPSQKGSIAFLRYVLGKTASVNNKIRNSVFNVTLDDFIKFADKLDQAKHTFCVAVVGEKEQILNQSGGIAKLFQRNLKMLSV